MKTSVVMATYNGEKFLKQQLDSILSQTVLPDELVIVDDGSTDRTCEILSNYKKEYPSVNFELVLRDKNIGYIMNFIDGINRSSHEYVFLCDQDDLWELNKIEKYLKFFENSQKAIVIHGEIDIIDTEERQIRGPQYGYKADCEYLDIKKFVRRVNYAGMSLAFKKSKISDYLNLLVEQRIKIATHDWLICYIAALQEGLYTTNNILTHRRYTGTNVALRLNQKRLSSIEYRIDGIDTYLVNYQMALACQNLDILNSVFDITPYIDTFEERKIVLKNKSKIRSFLMIRKLMFFPSFKSYIGDMLLQFRN